MMEFEAAGEASEEEDFEPPTKKTVTKGKRAAAAPAKKAPAKKAPAKRKKKAVSKPVVSLVVVLIKSYIGI